jgi:hypothetical protein
MEAQHLGYGKMSEGCFASPCVYYETLLDELS